MLQKDIDEYELDMKRRDRDRIEHDSPCRGCGTNIHWYSYPRRREEPRPTLCGRCRMELYIFMKKEGLLH